VIGEGEDLETEDRGRAEGSRRTPAFVWFVAAVFVALELGVGWRYGLFRDELYYLACASHLDWGYVDQPPFSIAVLALVRAVLGDSLFAVRLLPALAGGALVALGARLAREMGGSRSAAGLAAVAVAIVPQYLGLAGYFSMNVFDLVFWTLAALLVVRLVRDDEPRYWLPLGLVLGVALLNKIDPLVFGLGLAVATLATPLRRHLRRREPWLGAAIAVLIFSPYVLWQVFHGWATLEFMHNATAYKNVATSPVHFLLAQIGEIHPLNLWLWLTGLVWLLATRAGRRFRALGIVFLVALAVMVLGHGKPYYLGPAFPMLLAAGAVATDRGLGRLRARWPRPALLATLAAGGLALAPLAIPVLPVDTFMAYQRALGREPRADERQALGPLPQFFADRFGWREMTAEVARVVRSLPEAERERALIVTSNYGEAGALLYYGRGEGLPPVASQHNSFYLWGPQREDPQVVILVGMSAASVGDVFDEVHEAGRIVAPYAMPYETENPILVCRGFKIPLEEAWRQGRHYI
jgi:hypothetical protein